MTTPVTVVVTLLRAAPDVAEIAGTRIYAGAAPQTSAPPDLVVVRTGEAEAYDLDGATGAPETKVVVACRAATYADADRLSRAAVAALKDGVHVQGARHWTVTRDLVSDISPVDDAGSRTWVAMEGFEVIAE
ncbi:tail completion protein gp17 [Rhodoplanes elegans]|nr:DUF3168 domain-containing protein [Rhodoplanes elegans]